MKFTLSLGLGLLAAAAALPAQTAQETIDRALAAAPRPLHDGATVIKWNAGATYETLKKGTNRLLCFDRSGAPGMPPFAVQCTSIANLDRAAQNRKFDMMTDAKARQAAIDEAEKNGTRVKPEYGSVWYDMSGPDEAHAHVHATIAVPGATKATTGLPDNPKEGGAWLMNAGTSAAHVMIPGA